MIQFTLGCVLLALTIFFGGSELLANNDSIANRERTLKSQERKVASAKAIKSKYETIKEQTIILSDDIKTNLMNQLNIDETKYSFILTEPEKKDKVLTIYSFEIEGFETFPKIFNISSDVEKIKGLQLENVCYNCQINNKELVQKEGEIGFKIKGEGYVYNPEK